MNLPAFFVSHGAPTLALADSPTGRFLDGLGKALSRPDAIVVASAHYEAPRPMVSAAARPGTIHDFGGFPEPLYRITYPAPGHPALADRMVALLRRAGLDAASDPDRGLDHGIWVPLLRAWPDADVPVVGLSVNPAAGARGNHAVGRALSALRTEGVLVIGSGGLTHNLRELDWRGTGGDVPAHARAFSDWIHERLAAGDVHAVLDWERTAPAPLRNHPTSEHFMPLFVALGAAGDAPAATRIHSDFEMGSLCLDAYRFD